MQIVSSSQPGRRRSWWATVAASDLPAAVLFLLPSVLILGVFSFYPIVDVIRLSLYKWDNMGPVRTFVGGDNFRALLGSARFWNSLAVTFEYALVVTAASIVGGLVLAVLLNQRWLVARSMWRSLYFLPTITPTVAAAMVWLLLFNPGIGYVNVVLRAVGIAGPNWLGDQTWALPTIMLLGIWRRIGFNLVIYLAALQSLAMEQYEAAEVDGATAWQRFWYLTVPLVRPTTAMLVILGIADSFLVFDQIMVLTRGGPAGATEVIGYFMYLNAFTFFKMGYGAAIAVVMLVVIAGLTLVQWRFSGFGVGESVEQE
jgi:multiple sugar transport system permease protein